MSKFIQRLPLSQNFGIEVVKPTWIKASAADVARMLFGGDFGLEVFDKKGRRINTAIAENGITDQGLTDLLTTYFDEGTPITTWYFGLIAGTGTLAATDTLASHAGWTEFTDYTGDRKAWVPDAPSARAIGNTTTSDFAITGTGTLKGAFLGGAETGTSSILWSTGLFNSDVPVENGNTIKLSYALSG
jgi:hypothetical protein